MWLYKCDFCVASYSHCKQRYLILSWTVFMWVIRWLECPNRWSQMVHLKRFTKSCTVLICLLRLPIWLNLFPQSEHIKSWILWWMVLTWRMRSDFLEKLFSHCEHGNVEFRWVFILCRLNFILELNTSPHSGQLNLPWLSYPCRFKLLSDKHFLLQMWQVRTEVDSFFFLVLHELRWESSMSWEINPTLQSRQENTSQLQSSTPLNLNRTWKYCF